MTAPQPQFKDSPEGIVREFHCSIFEIKQAVLASDDRLSEQGARRKVIEAIASLADKAGRIPGLPSEDLREVEYLLAAIGDEVFLNLAWKSNSQADWWKRNLIESGRFGTHVAGQLIFDRIQKLVDHGRRSQREMARAYLLALGLGFQGMYRGRADQSELSFLRRRLWSLVREGSGSELASSDESRIPLPLHVDTSGAGRTSPEQRRWMFYLAITVAGWLAVTGVLWSLLTLNTAKFDKNRRLQ